MTEIRTVALLQYPTQLGVQAKQYNDELLREFTIIAAGRASGTADADIPERLVTLMETLRLQYGQGLEERDARLFAALASGVEEIDVEMQLPRAAGAAAQALDGMLKDADEYCRQGKHLLTLETPAHIVQFRQWFLHELVAQLDGSAPTPWPVYAAR